MADRSTQPVPKAVIFDLDGTLTPSKSPMTPEMGALLARLLDRMPVAIMSGGSFAQFKKQLMPGLPAGAQYERLYLFPTSAAQCFVHEGGEWIAKYALKFTDDERAEILAALAVALKAAGLDQPPAQTWGERIEDRGAQITFSALGQQAPIAEKMAWDPDRNKRAPAAQRLRELLPNFTIAVNATTSIDITRKDITKAYGLEQLSSMLGIPLTEMLYVGDALFPGGNDYVVVPTGIPTHPVSSPEDTADFIRSLL